MAATETLQVCFECEHELEHCHGTAIVHVSRSFECTESPDCPLPAELHIFVFGCEEDSCCGVLG
jgi:hypothetical protein